MYWRSPASISHKGVGTSQTSLKTQISLVWGPGVDCRLSVMYGPPPFCKRKVRVTELVCAHVYGLCSEDDLLAWMECAALSSLLVTRPLKGF